MRLASKKTASRALAARARRGGGRTARRRRRPEEAEKEILEAAEQLLRERPFRDLQIDQVMERTGLARPSFYQYFRDRHQLVIRLVDRLGAELYPMSERWFRGTGDPAADLRAAHEGVVEVYAKHGPVLRAIADAATHDRQVEKAYRGLIERFIQGTAERIRAEIAASRISPLDAETSAAALVWMSERYLSETLGRLPEVDPRSVADTLLTIWSRALYGQR